MNDVRAPVAVSHTLIYRVECQSQKALLALLYAGKAAHALEEKGINVMEIADILRLLPIAIEDTSLFDTVMAPGAIFTPVYYTVLTYSRASWRYRGM